MDSGAQGAERRNTHLAITEKIVKCIDAGPGTVQMPWHRSNVTGRPLNAVTGSSYRGVNVLSLWIDAAAKGFETGYWASYRQWQSLGAQVRKGEHGSPVLFYREVDADEDTDSSAENRKRFVARAFTVFNAAQVDGWQPPPPPCRSKVETLGQVENFVKSTGAAIREGRYEIACYDSAVDLIDMPNRSSFVGTSTSTPTESFYAVLLHELTHWSGHRSRLNRDLKQRFGTCAYAIEELVAELGAAFLCADLGIASEPRTDHAAYIADWLTVLRRDSRAITKAASQAHIAADYLMAFQSPGTQGP